MIEIKDVVKIYKTGKLQVKALDEISFRINAGEFVAIVGSSGSGKSTLMNIIGCIDLPTAGTYYLDGEDVVNYSEKQLAQIRNRKIGFVFQKFNLLPKFDALTNVELPLIYRGVERNISRQKAIELLQMVGLGDRMDHKPHELSGGQQQRVAVARALIGDPPLILADEPTGNLDTKSTQEIMELIKELNGLGRTVVLITHEQSLAKKCKRIITLQDGKIIEDMQTGEVLKS